MPNSNILLFIAVEKKNLTINIVEELEIRIKIISLSSKMQSKAGQYHGKDWYIFSMLLMARKTYVLTRIAIYIYAFICHGIQRRNYYVV